jgi:hypothetical protein
MTLETVWVVYQQFPNEGETIYAICSTEKKATKAKTELAARLTVPLHKFEISEVAFNAGHSYGLLVQDGSFDLTERHNKIFSVQSKESQLPPKGVNLSGCGSDQKE